MDNPEKPEFANWRSYKNFSDSVHHKRRHIFSPEMDAFLKTVIATSHKREVNIPKGSTFYRAQHGVDVVELDGEYSGCEQIFGHGRSRMKPLRDRASEGRINPAGVSVLYVASRLDTAVSEIRPWVGADVSVAKLQTVRSLKAIDLSKGHGQLAIANLTIDQLTGKVNLDAETKEEAVWIDIDNAFSCPIIRSHDRADYAPTQILSEMFSEFGFEAIIYKSQFGNDGYNLAIFDIDAAEVVACAPYSVRKLEIEVMQIGNEWFSSN